MSESEIAIHNDAAPDGFEEAYAECKRTELPTCPHCGSRDDLDGWDMVIAQNPPSCEFFVKCGDCLREYRLHVRWTFASLPRDWEQEMEARAEARREEAAREQRLLERAAAFAAGTRVVVGSRPGFRKLGYVVVLAEKRDLPRVHVLIDTDEGGIGARVHWFHPDEVREWKETDS